MDLSDNKKQLKDLVHYTNLSSQLEEIVSEDLFHQIKDISEMLKSMIPDYKKIISLQEESLRGEAESDREYVQKIHEIAEQYNVEVEFVREIFEKQSKKSDLRKKIECLMDMTKNSVLSIYSAPFSRNSSENYAKIARERYSTLKMMIETSKTEKRTEKIKQDNVKKGHEIEFREARLYSDVISKGLDEKTAMEFIQGKFFYTVLDSLADYYGLKRDE